jgi:hypothetical protein
MSNNLYGELESEKLASEFDAARKIVSEIENFGVSERQKYMIIYTIALSLEDVECMRELVGLINEFKGKEIFLTKKYDTGALNGKNYSTVRSIKRSQAG